MATISNSDSSIDKHALEKGHHHPINRSEPGFPIYERPKANPGPLGLFAFASTTLLLSLINVHARNVTAPNIVVGMAFALGGLAQFAAGIFEFVCGNTFGTTAFCSYGAFWFSFGIMFWPSSGILSAYESPEDLQSALGFFMMTWWAFTFFIFLATFRSSVGIVSLFAWLQVVFILLGAGYSNNNVSLLKAGGWTGLITAFNAFYVAAHALLSAEAAPFQLPNPSLARSVN